MRRTKIVCTMGPNTNSRDLMKKLIETGMDVARFNFSHGDHDEQKMRMDMLKELRKELKTPWQSFWTPKDRKFVPAF